MNRTSDHFENRQRRISGGNLFIWLMMILSVQPLAGQEIIIQENETGFCAMDGVIETSAVGYTGSGYVNVDAGVGTSISWNILAASDGVGYLRWRYAIGGNPGDRPARLVINGKVAVDTVAFPYTGDWTNWIVSDSVAVNFSAGSNNIRIEAWSSSGLGNYDYISIGGEGISASDCNTYFVLRVSRNIAEGGTVSYEPVQDYYPEGTPVTLRATANSGYFFQSWSGDQTSADSVYTFQISRNTAVEAIFLPPGAAADSALIGYATVQDDNGTPYIVLGGSLGQSVTASSLSDLKNYLSDRDPLVISITGLITGSENVTVASDKTIRGLDESAHLQGIGLEISNARNVILRDLKISHVTPQDAIEINGSKNIWIDHCELYSDREHGKDYYDGLLDIKNASSWITVSWSVFHDHYKVSLISSGDQAVEDSVTRITFHHNYFYNCESRMPSIRFGKAHIFNNYYKDDHTAINARMGACVRVERNYFTGTGTAVMMADSPEPGSVELIDNYFGTSGYATSPSCELAVPYTYVSQLDETADIPMVVAGEPAGIQNNPHHPQQYSMRNYPNPLNPATVIEYSIPASSQVKIVVYTLTGEFVKTLFDGFSPAGTYRIFFDGTNLSSGVYLCRLLAGDVVITRKLVIIK